MLSNTNKTSIARAIEQPRTVTQESRYIGGQKNFSEPQLSFETMFSSPGSVVVGSCLNKCHKCEPHVKETMQPEHLLCKRIRLLEKLQE